jgi:hypothetical protein
VRKSASNHKLQVLTGNGSWDVIPQGRARVSVVSARIVSLNRCTFKTFVKLIRSQP